MFLCCCTFHRLLLVMLHCQTLVTLIAICVVYLFVFYRLSWPLFICIMHIWYLLLHICKSFLYFCNVSSVWMKMWHSWNLFLNILKLIFQSSYSLDCFGGVNNLKGCHAEPPASDIVSGCHGEASVNEGRGYPKWKGMFKQPYLDLSVTNLICSVWLTDFMEILTGSK